MSKKTSKNRIPNKDHFSFHTTAKTEAELDRLVQYLMSSYQVHGLSSVELNVDRGSVLSHLIDQHIKALVDHEINYMESLLKTEKKVNDILSEQVEKAKRNGGVSVRSIKSDDIDGLFHQAIIYDHD